MAIYAIGDIHGCYNPLMDIFEVGEFDGEDTFVFLGDYVDRGPSSYEAICWLLELSKHYHFIYLKGNHEIMMLEARENRKRLSGWLHVGGSQTLDSYKITDPADWAKEISPEHWAFIENGKPYHEIDDFIFVHAGLTPGVPLEAQTDDALYWRKYQIPKPYSPDKVVICGHTSRKNGKIADFGHTICIDTYAYGGQWLTCLNVETKTFIQANSEGKIQKGQL